MSIVDYLVKPITEDRFQKQFKSSFFEKDSIKKIKPKKRTPQNEFYVNDRRLIKNQNGLGKYRRGKGDYIHIKTEKNYVILPSRK
jgi:response regulator of citrate/malate metabolism